MSGGTNSTTPNLRDAYEEWHKLLFDRRNDNTSILHILVCFVHGVTRICFNVSGPVNRFPLILREIHVRFGWTCFFFSSFLFFDCFLVFGLVEFSEQSETAVYHLNSVWPRWISLSAECIPFLAVDIFLHSLENSFLFMLWYLAVQGLSHLCLFVSRFSQFKPCTFSAPFSPCNDRDWVDLGLFPNVLYVSRPELRVLMYCCISRLVLKMPRRYDALSSVYLSRDYACSCRSPVVPTRVF